MLVGLDFDNTLVCYDAVFHAEALALGLVPASLPEAKDAVRDHVRATAGDLQWQRLQALVYGRRMARARLKEGAADFLRRCRERGLRLAVVSHKTETSPVDPGGPDLRRAALHWMEGAGFFAPCPGGFGFAREEVFFESTREAKVARINALGCAAFVDDLPEVLGHPGLDPAVRRILFAPAATPDARFHFRGLWPEIARHVLG